MTPSIMPHGRPQKAGILPVRVQNAVNSISQKIHQALEITKDFAPDCRKLHCSSKGKKLCGL